MGAQGSAVEDHSGTFVLTHALKPHIDFAVSGDEGPDGLIEALRTAINRKQLRRVK